MPVAYSKNKPQYAFLALFLGGLTALCWALGGPVFAGIFLGGAFLVGVLW